MPRAPQAVIDLLNDYFGVMEAKDYERLRSYYADDITLTFANAPTVTGSEAVPALMVDLTGRLRSLKHTPIRVWQDDGGVVILEVLCTYHLNDDSVIEITGCSIFTIADDKFADMRLYVDHTPVDAALA